MAKMAPTIISNPRKLFLMNFSFSCPHQKVPPSDKELGVVKQKYALVSLH